MSKKKINLEDINCPLPISRFDTVQLSHGSGGKMSNDLIGKLFVWAFDNEILNKQDDQALLRLTGDVIAIPTDSAEQTKYRLLGKIE